MRYTSSVLFGFVLVGLSLTARLHAGDGGSKSRLEAQSALKAYGGLVGSWRGTGQPERGKVRGSWLETSSWVWKLAKDSAALEMTVNKGKYLRSGLLRPGSEPKSFVFEATLSDGSQRRFAGKETAKKSLALTAEGKGEGVRRITLTPLHDSRLLVKLEAQDPSSNAFYQLGEVGYTREGIAFAAGESAPVCIVTEGRGSIPVTYKGKTYYVCCSGCRDLFNENPEAVLAEAAERAKAKETK